MKVHKHTWTRNGILCDYRGCYEGSPNAWHDDPILFKVIMYLLLWFTASIVGLVLAYFIGLKGFLIGVSTILLLAWISRYYGITKA